MAAGALIAIAPLLAACGSSGSSAAASSHNKAPITIGTIGAFSGPDASTGDANTAVLAYFKALNAKGGIDGHMVNVLKGDDQYNSALTPGIARKLLPKVAAFCGVNGTPNNIAIQALLAQSKVPNIAPATGAAALTKPVSPTQYVVVADYGRLSTGLVDYAVKKLHKTRIALLYINGDAGAPALAGVKSEAAKDGAALVSAQSYDLSDTTLSAQMAKIKAANPDFVIAESVSQGFALAVNTAHQIGLDTTWGNLFFGGTPQFAQLTHNSTSGRAYISTFLNQPSEPSSEQAIATIQKYYSSIPDADAQALQGWTLADACAAVIKKTLDSGEAVTSANLIKTANNFSLDDTFVHGLKWTPQDHAGVTQYAILKQQGANFVPVTGFKESAAY
ncbi:ABC transporter substrate-binding protein [Nocardioides terrisoli]|uniref:ABC transporter substrate-binding protein n=1 Tax=Nocardioides terrisoli TaxID=3388267 RepID=UPI00287B5BBE|nr:ABC transporter substrate-binding protein [Nocardioides marmorisolisilvae]